MKILVEVFVEVFFEDPSKEKNDVTDTSVSISRRHSFGFNERVVLRNKWVVL